MITGSYTNMRSVGMGTEKLPDKIGMIVLFRKMGQNQKMQKWGFVPQKQFQGLQV